MPDNNANVGVIQEQGFVAGSFGFNEATEEEKKILESEKTDKESK